MITLDKEGPICPMCNIRAIKLYKYNGQPCCRNCKQQIKQGNTIIKIERREK